MKTGYVQFNPAFGEVNRNLDRVEALIEGAQADLLVLPELFNTGYLITSKEEIAALAEEVPGGPTTRRLAAVAKRRNLHLVAGMAERSGDRIYNAAVLISPAGHVATYRKVHRFGFGSGEPKLMEAGRGRVVLPLPLQAGGSVMVGLATCYDLRFPELFRLLGEAGAEAFVVPAAWPLPRVAHWTLLGQARAIENQCAIIQVNTGGTHHNTVMGGNSQVVAAQGEVLGTIDGNGEAVLVATIDLAALADYRETFPVLADRRL